MTKIRKGDPKRVGLVLDQTEHEMLVELASDAGLDMSNWVRQTIRRLHAERQRAQKSAARTL
jgi:hypothetical protein